MEIIFNFESFRKINENFILTIGNFDGLHKGHIIILKLLKEVSSRLNLKSVLFTFVSKPSLLKTSSIRLKNILPFEDKIEFLKSFGFDYIVVQEFNKDFFNLECNEFLDKLFENENFKGLILGENFKFGKDRKGDIDFIKEYLSSEKIKKKELEIIYKKYENLNIFNDSINVNINSSFFNNKKFFILFEVSLYFENHIYISSTYIREKIEEGDISINKYLFLPFYIKGVVEEGKKAGRKIGFQTANIYIYEQISPKPGVYFTITEIVRKEEEDNKYFYSMTYVGDDFRVETHLFNFEGFIYKEYIRVYFIERLRDNKKISSLEELRILLENDKKNIFEKYAVNDITPSEFLKSISLKEIKI